MIFFLSAIDQKGKDRQFSFHLDQLEKGLDFLNSLVAGGEKLIQVSVSDEGQLINLPVEAFDGLPHSTFMGELEAEWKVILETLPSQKVVERDQALLAQCEAQIVRTELLITQLNELRQQAQIYQDRGASLRERYQAILSSYHNQLAQAYRLRKHVLKYLLTD